MKIDGLTENTRMDRHLGLTDSSYLMPCPFADLKSLLLLINQLRWHLHESQNLLARFSDWQSSVMCPPCIFAFSGSLRLSVSCLRLFCTPQTYFLSFFVQVMWGFRSFEVEQREYWSWELAYASSLLYKYKQYLFFTFKSCW